MEVFSTFQENLLHCIRVLTKRGRYWEIHLQRPRDFLRRRGRRGWICQYLSSFGGVLTFYHHQRIMKGLTVLKSILPCCWWKNYLYQGLLWPQTLNQCSLKAMFQQSTEFDKLSHRKSITCGDKNARDLTCHTASTCQYSTWPWTFVHYLTPLDVCRSHIDQWSIQFEDKVSPKICDAEFCKSFIVVFQNGPNIIWFWNSHINIHIVQRRGEVGGQTHVTTVIGYIWGPKSATWSTSLPLVLQMSIKCTILRAVLLFHIDQTFNVNTWPSLESSALGSPWSTQASPLEANEPIAARWVLLGQKIATLSMMK